MEKRGWRQGGERAGVRVKAPSVHVRETLWSVRTCTPSRARREKEERLGGRKSEREGLRAVRDDQFLGGRGGERVRAIQAIAGGGV